ncbi:MAG: DUF4143 domain-containing protein [Deltaproteobacteria bacterium]|nr:DUF4143 domain-containing protein [Deltaproteobacteria bacterium]
MAFTRVLVDELAAACRRRTPLLQVIVGPRTVGKTTAAEQRGSSPKLVLWNNALVNALSLRSFSQAIGDGGWWGRLVENAVGAHLLNGLPGPDWSVTYWRDGDAEVDFVVAHGTRVWALEVKSGRPGKVSGLQAFRKRYPKATVWLIGAGGLGLEDFFGQPATHWFRRLVFRADIPGRVALVGGRERARKFRRGALGRRELLAFGPGPR